MTPRIADAAHLIIDDSCYISLNVVQGVEKHIEELNGTDGTRYQFSVIGTLREFFFTFKDKAKAEEQHNKVIKYLFNNKRV